MNRGTICSLTVLTFITKQIMATEVQMHQSHHAEHREMGNLGLKPECFSVPHPSFFCSTHHPMNLQERQK